MSEPRITLSDEEISRFLSEIDDQNLPNFRRVIARANLIEAGVIEDDTKPSTRPVKLRSTFRPNTAIGTPPPKGEYKRRIISVCLDDIEEEEYEWFWRGRLPNRTVSLIAGDGGAGKSTLTGALAATVTTGGCWPDFPGERIEPGRVVILSAEENAATDIRPRYNRFGADCRKVHIVKAIDAGPGCEQRFSLARDVPELRDFVDTLGNVRLLMIDPVGSYLNGSDSHNDAEVQHALTPLFQLAEDCRLAVVLIAHLTKQSSADIQSRIQGAAAFVNKSRMVWYYSPDPRDHSRRMLSFIKGNPVDKTITALSVGFTGGVLAWDPEPVPMTAKQVAFRLAKQAERGELDGKRGPVSERRRVIIDVIRSRLEKGPAKLSEVEKEAAEECEATRGAVDRAIKKLNGHVRRFKGDDKSTWLELRPHLELDQADPEPPK